MEKSSSALHLASIKNIHAVIGIAIMIAFNFVPTVDPITPIGMKIVGIFIGTLYLWMTVDVLWSSVVCVFMVAVSGYGSVNSVLQLAFGAPIVVQTLFMFIFVGALTVEGITDHIGRWFLRFKFAEGKPWVLTFMLCLGAFFIAAFVRSVAAIILFWAIANSIFETVGYTREDKYPKLLVILIALATVAGFPVAPYMQNGLALLSNFQTISNGMYPINNGMYLVNQIVLGILYMLVSILVCKFVFRPNTEKLLAFRVSNLDKDPLKPLDARQKVLAVVFVALVLGMLLPNWFPGVPIMDFLKKCTIALPMAACGFLAGFYVFDKQVVNIGNIMVSQIPWGTMFLIIAAVMLGSVLTDAKTGVTAWLSAVLGPILSGMSTLMFVIVLLVLLMLLTNFSNSLVIGMITQPIILLYCETAGINPAPIIVLAIYFVLSCALFTPAASPYAAMLFSNDQWLDPKDIYKYTGVLILAELVLMVVVGYPLTALLIS